MGEKKPIEFEKLAEEWRAMCAPNGMRERIRESIELKFQKRRRRRFWIGLLFIPVTAVATVAVNKWIPVYDQPVVKEITEETTFPRKTKTSQKRINPATEQVTDDEQNQLEDQPLIEEENIKQDVPKSHLDSLEPIHQRRHDNEDLNIDDSQPPLTPSELAEQVAAYRFALRLSDTDPSTALGRWQRMKKRWPQSPLLHEIDLQIVQTLFRLGRYAQGKSEANKFLSRYPNSPKLDEVRELMNSSSN